MSHRCLPFGLRPSVAVAGASVLLATAGCGSSPPNPATLVQHTSAHMAALKGFHFNLEVSGFTGTVFPVQSADGDASPPDLDAQVNLILNTVLLQFGVIVSGDQVYLRGPTGGWTRLTPQQVASFFDVHALFDPHTGLFAAMRETSGLTVASQPQAVDSHQTWPVSGQLAAARVHQLLSVARDSGSDAVTYWIESPKTLWKAEVQGNLFDSKQKSSIIFTFSKHDQPVTITPPSLG